MIKYNRSLFLFLTVVLFIFLSVPPAQGEISVKPLSLRLKAPAGETDSSTLTIRNQGGNTSSVQLRLVDWWRTPEGNLQMLPPGTRDRSATDWIVFSPNGFDLEPGEKTEVQVEVSVPEETKPEGDHWAMLLVRGEQANSEEESGMKVSVGYAVKILVEDTNAKGKSGKITNIQPANHNPFKISVEYRNTGTSYIKTDGAVEIRNLQGETERTFEIKEFPTLPGEKRIIKVGLKDSSEPLTPGQYYAIVTMDYGGDHAIQGGRPIEIRAPDEESSNK